MNATDPSILASFNWCATENGSIATSPARSLPFILLLLSYKKNERKTHARVSFSPCWPIVLIRPSIHRDTLSHPFLAPSFCHRPFATATAPFFT
jgi:hypothetical protein